MYKCYVYLILSKNRLVITQTKIDNKDYHLMLNNDGNNLNTLISYCKTYCAGVQAGVTMGIMGYKIENDMMEWAN